MSKKKRKNKNGNWNIESTRKEVYPVDHVLDLISSKELRVVLDGDSVGVSSLRLINFLHHGTTCVSCGISGTIFVKEKCNPNTSTYHLALYSQDDNGNPDVLITMDHIIPTSKGGKDELHNLQTMCKVCNEKKGNSLVVSTN